MNKNIAIGVLLLISSTSDLVSQSDTTLLDSIWNFSIDRSSNSDVFDTTVLGKSLFGYNDQSQRIDEQVFQYDNTAGAFTKSMRTLTSYHNQELKDSITVLVGVTGDWVRSERQINDFEGTNRTRHLTEDWDVQNKSWIGSRRNRSVFNEKNQRIFSAWEGFNRETGIWDTSQLDIQHFDQLDRVDTSWHSNYSRGKATQRTKDVYSYSEDGLSRTGLIYLLRPTGFQLWRKEVRNMNANGLLLPYFHLNTIHQQ